MWWEGGEEANSGQAEAGGSPQGMEALNQGPEQSSGRLKGAGSLAAQLRPPQDRGPGCKAPFPSHDPRGPGSPASVLAGVHLAQELAGHQVLIK